MKYALIAMAVIYLITFGCSPEEKKTASESHEQATHTAVQATPQGGEAPAAVHQEEQAAKAVVEHKENTTTDNQPAMAAESAPVVEPANMSKESQPVEKQPVTAEKPPVAAAAEADAKQPASQAADGEDMITMPCGRKIAQKDVPAGAPCVGYAQPTTAPSNEDLNAAMQKLVEATNNMVRVNRQMIIATQEMLNASKKIAAEGKDSKQ